MHSFDDFKSSYKGDAFDDDWIRTYYSVDASEHQIYPSIICYPKDKSDIVESLHYSRKKNLSVTCRGAGTGLLGQSLSNGLILDFTKFMNNILEIDTKSNIVFVQPGVVKGVLDKELKKHDKFLPPDPASSNYCTVGGMVSNNSSGAHSLGFGSTIDYLCYIDFIYADGTEGYAKNDNCDEKMKKFLSPILPYYKQIISVYPRVNKNSCGYRIDSLFNKGFKPQNIFAASEGTLGIFNSIGLKIMDIPVFRSLFLVSFSDILIASKYVKKLLSTSPVAIELLDSSVIDSFIQSSILNKKNGCLVFVEYFYEFKNKIDFIHNSLLNKIKPDGQIVEQAHDDLSIIKLWHSRKNALNLAIKNTIGTRKPFTITEDTTVHPDYFSQYVEFLLNLYHKYDLHYVVYGHMGNGNLHTRPIIDHDPNYIPTTGESANKIDYLIKQLTEAVFSKVLQYQGTITGEHGDGISRSPYVRQMYGSFVYSFFKNIKKSFDPLNLLNPGKKVV